MASDLASSASNSETIEDPSKQGRTWRALMWNIPMTVYGMIAIYVMTIIVLQTHLGTSEFGVFSMLWASANAIILGLFALQTALIRFLPELELKKSFRQISKIYHGTLLTQLALWCILLAIVLAGRNLFLRELEISSVLPILGALGFVCCRLIMNSQASVLQAFKDVKRLAIVQAANRTLSLLLVIAAVCLQFQEWEDRITACFFALALCDLLAVCLTRARVMGHFRRPSDSHATIGLSRLLSYAAPLLVTSIMNQIANPQINALLIGILGKKESAGAYKIASEIPIRTLEFIPIAIWPIALATLAASHTRDPRTLAKGIARYYKLLFMLLFPLIVGGTMFGDRVLIVLPVDKHPSAYVPCQILFALTTIVIFRAPLTVCLHVTEKTWLFFVSAVLGAAVNVSFGWILIPRWGIFGAVFAVGMTYFALACFQYIFVKRYVPDIHVPWRILMTVALGCTALLPALLLRNFVRNAHTLVLTMIACGVLTVIGYRLFRVIDIEILQLISQSRLPLKNTVLAILTTRSMREKATDSGSLNQEHMTPRI